MKVLLIVAHPNTDKSFNHALVKTACDQLRAKGHEVVVRDLYADHFDPVMPLGEEKLPLNELPREIQDAINDVKTADALIFVHPNWWSGPPAILRGWLDRVFRAGFAYRFSPEGAVPMLAGKKALVVTTANTPQDVDEKVYHRALENFWRTIVFGLVGCSSFDYLGFTPVILSTPEIRTAWLQELRTLLDKRF